MRCDFAHVWFGGPAFGGTAFLDGIALVAIFDVLGDSTQATSVCKYSIQKL